MTYYIWLEDGLSDAKYLMLFNPTELPKKLTFWDILKLLFS